MLRAADAGEFIYQVARELSSPSELGVAARRRILRDYRWDANLQRLGAALGVQEAERTDQADRADPAARLAHQDARAARDAGGVPEKAL